VKTIINFKQVGRMKKDFTLAFAGRIDQMGGIQIANVKREGCLASNDVELFWDTEAKTGEVVVGGLRTVGMFTYQEVE
jgi:hypothetical protein